MAWSEAVQQIEMPVPPAKGVVMLAPSLDTRLEGVHEWLRSSFPGIERVAAALYDEKTDTLTTFVNSTDGGSPLVRYEAKLSEVPSLEEMGRTRRDRVVDDFDVFAGSPSQHSAALLQAGYRSSYTTPFYDNGHLGGFLFFDSRKSGYFTRDVASSLRTFGNLIAVLLLHSLVPIRMLRSAAGVAARLSHYRDPETGAHLDRMSHVARLIGRILAPACGLSDEFVEFLFLFSPLHDVGKIAIPDRILLKNGPLDHEEFAVMKTHVTRGAEIVEAIVGDLGLETLPHVGVLRNIVLSHHEAVDGSGYPGGLAGESIALEARIVAVADVFDALTSVRPYKTAWTVVDAVAYLEARVGAQFDSDCVQALVDHLEYVAEIRSRFPDREDETGQSREGYTPDF